MTTAIANDTTDGPPSASSSGSSGGEADSIIKESSETAPMPNIIQRRGLGGATNATIKVVPHLSPYVGPNEERLIEFGEYVDDAVASMKPNTIVEIGDFNRITNNTTTPDGIVAGPGTTGSLIYWGVVIEAPTGQTVSLHDVSVDIEATALDREFSFADQGYSRSRQGLLSDGTWIKSGAGSTRVKKIVLFGVSSFFIASNTPERSQTLKWILDRSPYSIVARVSITNNNGEIQAREETVYIDDRRPFTLDIESGISSVIMSVNAEVGLYEILGAPTPNGPWSAVRKSVSAGDQISIATTGSMRFFQAHRTD